MSIKSYFETSTPQAKSERQIGQKATYIETILDKSLNSSGTSNVEQISYTFAHEKTQIQEIIDTTLIQVRGEIRKDLSDILDQKMTAFEEKINKLTKRVSKLEAENHNLRINNEELKTSIQSVKRWANQNEQYSRKNHLRIFGLPQNKNEDPVKRVHTLVTDKLKVKLDIKNIDAAHRIGTPKPHPTDSTKPPTPAPMIVRFLHRQDRSNVLLNRKKLKSSGTSIHEDIDCSEC